MQSVYFQSSALKNGWFQRDTPTYVHVEGAANRSAARIGADEGLGSSQAYVRWERETGIRLNLSLDAKEEERLPAYARVGSLLPEVQVKGQQIAARAPNSKKDYVSLKVS